MILFKQVNLYNPHPLGKKDVLIAGGKIEKIADTIDVNEQDVEVVDREGYTMIPGLIDNHVHITGGGGEAGYASRVPEIQLSNFIQAGITSVIGLLGTDGHTRSMKNLIAKVKGLKSEGMSAYALTGSYQVPVKTLMRSIEDDMLYIDEIIGAGEIAISDHRSSVPTMGELKKILSAVHVGGLLSGKGGVLNLHVGSGKDKLKPITTLIEETDLPVRKLIPTHMNRNETLLEDAIAYSKYYKAPIDFTAYSHKDDELSAYRVIKRALDAGVDPCLITMSSDGQGSLPVFDEQGNFIKMGVGSVEALLDNIKKGVLQEKIALDMVLKTVTSNVARLYHLDGKGKIEEGYDADIVVMSENFTLEDVLMHGVFMMRDKTLCKKGLFE